MLPKPGKSFDPLLIRKAIQDAGFSLRELVVTADGILTRGKDFLELEVPGLKQAFVLSGGRRAGELDAATDLMGKRVRVTGRLHPSHADQLPGLTVEDFQT